MPEPHVTESDPNVTDEPIKSGDSFTVLSKLLPTAEACKVKTTDRIFGGKKAQEDEYPWTVLLEYSKRKIINSFLW